MRFLKETQSTGNNFRRSFTKHSAPSNKNILCLGLLWCPKWVSQWLRLWAPNVRGTSWIAGWETKILHATSCGQNGKKKNILCLKGKKKKDVHTSKLNLQPKHHIQFSFALRWLLWRLALYTVQRVNLSWGIHSKATIAFRGEIFFYSLFQGLNVTEQNHKYTIK